MNLHLKAFLIGTLAMVLSGVFIFLLCISTIAQYIFLSCLAVGVFVSLAMAVGHTIMGPK